MKKQKKVRMQSDRKGRGPVYICIVSSDRDISMRGGHFSRRCRWYNPAYRPIICQGVHILPRSVRLILAMRETYPRGRDTAKLIRSPYEVLSWRTTGTALVLAPPCFDYVKQYSITARLKLNIHSVQFLRFFNQFKRI